MDWEKAKKIAVISNIGAFVVGTGAFIVGCVWFVYAVWFEHPSPESGQPQSAISEPLDMKTWLPPVIIGAFVLVAAIFNLVTAYMSARNLKKQVSDLTDANRTLKGENETLASDLKKANRNSETWKSQYHEANNGGIELRSERDNYQRRLTTASQQIENLTAELAQSKKDAENANKRANQEINQKNEFYKLHNESTRKLADLVWVRDLADEQAKDISEHVVVIGVRPRSLVLSKGHEPLCVTVAFRIRNESVFDINIEPNAIRGKFGFNGRLLHESAVQLLDEDHALIEHLKPKKAETLVIKQPLLQSEAEFISGFRDDDQARFWLSNLSIPISFTASGFVQGSPPDLRIGSKLEYVHLSEFSKPNTTSEDAQKEVLSIQELRQQIAALQPDDRAKATKAALELYGEDLYGTDPPQSAQQPISRNTKKT